MPLGGIEQGFFAGRSIVDVDGSLDLHGGTTLAIGAQNLLDVYPQESTRAMSVGEKYSEYTPWGFNGAYYYARIRYGWGGLARWTYISHVRVSDHRRKQGLVLSCSGTAASDGFSTVSGRG